MSKPFKSIPGPKELPIVGAFGALNENPLQSLPALVEQHGDIVRFSFIGRQFLLLANPAYIHEVLVEKAAQFPKGKRDVEILSRFLGNGLLTNDGASHRRQRKLAQPAFHARRIQAYADIMVRYAQEVSAQWQEGQVRNLFDDLREITLYIVAKTLFDADRHEMAATVAEVGAAIYDVQTISDSDFNAVFSLPDWLPTERNRRRRRAVATLDAVVGQVLALRKAQAVDGVLPDKGDLLSMLMLARDEDGNSMDERQLRDELVTIFVAGHETTTNALTWTFYLLAQHPEVAEKVYAEVDAALGKRTPVLADLAALPYSLRVIKESMRLYPPAWVLNTREPRTAVTIGEYTVPAGTQIFISQWVMHRLARYFPEPERFAPERWTPAFEESMPRYAYMPFGGGPRICIGNSFAMMEAQLVLATLLQRFRLALEPGQTVEPEPLITLGPKQGLWMQVHVRDR
jgi:cytochrome P450